MLPLSLASHPASLALPAPRRNPLRALRLKLRDRFAIGLFNRFVAVGTCAELARELEEFFRLGLDKVSYHAESLQVIAHVPQVELALLLLFPRTQLPGHGQLPDLRDPVAGRGTGIG